MNASTSGVSDNNAEIADDRSSRPIWLGEDHRGWDHVRVHRDVILDPRMTHYHLAVYAGLALHAELRTGDARPAQATLADYAQCGERKVRDCLKEMSDWGYIEIEERPGKASFYRLLPPPTFSPPRQEMPGSFSPPRQEMPPTPAPGADEQEPRTRLNNSSVENFTRARSAGSVDNSGAWLLERQRLISDGHGCPDCEQTGLVESEADLWQQCDRCKGSGVLQPAAQK